MMSEMPRRYRFLNWLLRRTGRQFYEEHFSFYRAVPGVGIVRRVIPMGTYRLATKAEAGLPADASEISRFMAKQGRKFDEIEKGKIGRMSDNSGLYIALTLVGTGVVSMWGDKILEYLRGLGGPAKKKPVDVNITVGPTIEGVITSQWAAQRQRQQPKPAKPAPPAEPSEEDMAMARSVVSVLAKTGIDLSGYEDWIAAGAETTVVPPVAPPQNPGKLPAMSPESISFHTNAGGWSKKYDFTVADIGWLPGNEEIDLILNIDSIGFPRDSTAVAIDFDGFTHVLADSKVSFLGGGGGGGKIFTTIKIHVVDRDFRAWLHQRVPAPAPPKIRR